MLDATIKKKTQAQNSNQQNQQIINPVAKTFMMTASRQRGL